MPFGTDQILWYNNGVWGRLGYAVPNFGNDPTTLNSSISYLVDAIGRNLFGIMQHPDASLRVPPSLNTLTRVHKLCIRARSILAGRDVASGQNKFEPLHATPAPEDFVLYPTPYFKVRNRWLKEYAGLAIMAMTEAMQHTENRVPVDFSQQFSGLVGQYIARIYRLMNMELLAIPEAEAIKPDFTLTDVHLAAYAPEKFFTSSEMVDTVSPLIDVPTEDDLDVLSQGIAASQLVGLAKYPSGGAPPIPGSDGAGTGATTGSSSVIGGGTSFAPPPSP
ncbi:MAG: hypothetical protein K8T25_17540 [Planctomycetia bacterium]|nr:hypothetical protein [Planctomycetia bacterium]